MLCEFMLVFSSSSKEPHGNSSKEPHGKQILINCKTVPVYNATLRKYFTTSTILIVALTSPANFSRGDLRSFTPEKNERNLHAFFKNHVNYYPCCLRYQ